MNDDYLWDKSGPPDPEVQQLEEILGALRYQPKPFEIPRDVPAPRRRNYYPLIAIAASLLMALLAGAIWLQVRTRKESQPQQAGIPNTPSVTPTPERIIPAPEPKQTLAPRENIVTVRHKKRNSAPVLGKREREEALAAKEQLMIALRLASEKLNLAQKKTQGTPNANQIKNHHRVG